MGLSKDLIRKFQRSNVLQLIRRDPQVIARWHPCNLEALRLTGLTLTERRAIHHHMRPVADALSNRSSDPLTERKLNWIGMMKSNLKDALHRYHNHVESTDGSSGEDHQCACVGRQCPVRADRVMDYSGGGLGFPAGNAYEESLDGTDPANVPKQQQRVEKVIPQSPPQPPQPPKTVSTTRLETAAKKPTSKAAPVNLLAAIRARRKNAG